MSKMVAVRQGLTLEEFLRLPEEKPALEYADGMATQKVSPQGKHGVMQYALSEWINLLLRPIRVALAIPELRTTYTNHSLVPDVAVYRWERIPRDTDGEIANEFREPPDIAIEIVSPDQSVRKLTTKCRWYVSNGVQLALLVSPEAHTVTVFRPDAEPVVLCGSDLLDLAPVLPGMTLAMDAPFAALRIA